ncbi:hypothetical protein [Knoellia koreensis]|uniref:Uncharacterized protein n=1 Tax=Knoellia koreensis TaxID=2730921 RepID=A0A849HIW8_9MICO|nr:hypothetical protein [Knoellia sp. DB2414S]NNM46261.1 hypothetical protein [Knoellia sp. DB2414S]
MTTCAPPRSPAPATTAPNLATLDRFRGLRRPRLMQPEARRHQIAQECRAC